MKIIYDIEGKPIDVDHALHYFHGLWKTLPAAGRPMDAGHFQP